MTTPGDTLREFAQRLSDEAVRYGEKAKAERGVDGLLNVAVGEALMRTAHMAANTASAIEARRVETEGLDAEHESAARDSEDAQ